METFARDVISAATARAVAAWLDRHPDEMTAGVELPALWHWFHFLPVVRRSERGTDGHPRRGGFLPRVALPRRMWAGGRLRFHRPLCIGEQAERRSEVMSVEEKQGRSGPLVFVKVRHVITATSGIALEEEQDLVYRDAPRPDEPRRSTTAPRQTADWTESFNPDSMTLFMFSALTLNGHRIHYDQPYATQVEGYPALVVHGPLIALLLLDSAVRRTGRTPATYSYRALGPLYNEETFTIAGRAPGEDVAEMWALDGNGMLAMRAQVEWKV
jgi:3-methylfumaryl-CoA hydratase